MSDLLRTCLEKLNLTEMQRDFYDSSAARDINIQVKTVVIYI